MKIRFNRDEKILLALMASINFSHIVDFMILMPLGPVLTRLFGLSVREFGLLVSVYSLSAAASGILGMVFLDRFDRKQSLLFYYAGFAISTVACAFAPTFAALLMARAFAGAFGGMLSSLVMAIISDAIAYERRGTAMGVVMGSFSLASILGVPFSLLLANHFGWQTPFYFLGLVSFLVWLLVFTWMKPMGGHLTGIRHSALDVVKRVSKNPPQVWALLFICTILFGQFTVIPFISQSYVYNAGLPENHLFYIYFFGGLCSIIGSPLAGRLADRYTKHKVFMVSALISLVPLYLITHLTPHSVWILITISSSFFFVTAGRMVPAMALVSSTVTPQFRGSFMSFATALQQLSLSASAALGAWIVTSGEHGQLEHYGTAGLVSMAFSVAAVWLCTRIPHGQAV